MANRANMAGKQLRRSDDVSRYIALSNEYARGDGRGAIRITGDTVHAGVSNEYYLETTPMSPYIGAESARLMDGGLSGCSLDRPVVMGVGRSDPTLSMKGQSKRVDSGRPEFRVPTDLIEEPMSPYLEGVSGFMDYAHGGYSVNHSLVRGVEGSDPAISTKVQSTGMRGGRPELPVRNGEIRQQPMLPYIGDVSVRLMDSALSGHHVDHPMERGIGGSNTAVSTKGQSMEVGVGRANLPVPPDASSTLFVEGLPANCTRREASHIFRPFIGYKEVRLATRKQRRPGAGPLVLCFVDFVSPAHAAAAKVALQGYIFDEHDRYSACLKLEFASNPGARFRGAHREER